MAKADFEALSLPWSISTDRNVTRVSRDAAIAMAGKAGATRRKVYDAICESPNGLTDREIQKILGMGGSTERPRRLELWKAGLITGDGVRKIGNRMGTVWISTDPSNVDVDPPDEYGRKSNEYSVD
jgi:hypothetical protein